MYIKVGKTLYQHEQNEKSMYNFDAIFRKYLNLMNGTRHFILDVTSISLTEVFHAVQECRTKVIHAIKSQKSYHKSNEK